MSVTLTHGENAAASPRRGQNKAYAWEEPWTVSPGGLQVTAAQPVSGDLYEPDSSQEPITEGRGQATGGDAGSPMQGLRLPLASDHEGRRRTKLRK